MFALISAAACDGKEDAGIATSTALAGDVPVAVSNNLTLFERTVNGSAPLTLVLDTGTSDRSAIARAEQLGLNLGQRDRGCAACG